MGNIDQEALASDEQCRPGSRSERICHEPHVRADASDLLQPKATGEVDRSRPRTSQRWQSASTDQHRGHVADYSIDESFSQERTSQRGTPLQEDGANFTLLERLEERLKVQTSFGAWQPYDDSLVLQVDGVCILRDGDEGRRGVVKHPGSCRRAGVGVHHDAERLTALYVPDRQVGVIHGLSTGADHDRVALGPEPMGIGAGLWLVIHFEEPSAAAIRPSRLAPYFQVISGRLMLISPA
jgi:hypothetical protein